MLFNLTDIANLATAGAAVFAAVQLYLVKRQATTSFEDSLAKEYRDLCQQLPTMALLGSDLPEKEYQVGFDAMYHYFDLCNQQVFYASDAEYPERLGTSGKMESNQI